jgi:hypothetical protein
MENHIRNVPRHLNAVGAFFDVRPDSRECTSSIRGGGDVAPHLLGIENVEEERGEDEVFRLRVDAVVVGAHGASPAHEFFHEYALSFGV